MLFNARCLRGLIGFSEPLYISLFLGQRCLTFGSELNDEIHQFSEVWEFWLGSCR